MSRNILAALPLVLALLLPAPIHASAICDSLNSRLTALSETYSAPARVRKYARAIAEQKMSIRELRHQMRETGCTSGSMLIIGGEAEEECADLEAKMARMETNLSILNEKRISLVTEQDEDTERERLLASYESNGCNEEAVLASAFPEPMAPEESETQLRGDYETIRIPSSDEDYGDRQFVDLGGSAVNGSYRTMCVRTCDGSYFPISSQATPLSFQRDAQVCSMMCPGVETELYYHSIRQETDAMRSAFTGRPYDELDNAYRFRTGKKPADKSCSCNFSLYYKEMMRREAYIKNPEKRETKQSSIVWVKPELRGELTAEATPKPMTEAKLRDYKPDRHIRQIGPKFLPDAEGVDFRNPRPVAQN